MYSGHPLSGTPTGPAEKFEIVNVRDSGHFTVLAFCKTLVKSNTVFTLNWVSLKGNRRENIY